MLLLLAKNIVFEAKFVVFCFQAGEKFLGSQLVDWLMMNKNMTKATSQQIAELVSQELLHSGLILTLDDDAL